MEPTGTQPHADALDHLARSGGFMGSKLRAHDWSESPLGAIEGWPQSLRTAVSVVLESRLPSILYWGDELTAIYNDAYRPLLGSKPEALGRSFPDIWSEALEIVGPIAEKALAGEASYFESTPFTLLRNGYPEQAWFDWSFSPIRDETGSVVGFLNVTVETTRQVLAERRQTFLLELGDRLRGLSDPVEIQSEASRLLGERLGASRVYYAEFEPDENQVTIHRDYHDSRHGVPSIAGRYRLEDFGPTVTAGTRAGRTVVIRDAVSDPQLSDSEREAWAAIQARGAIVVPLIRRRRLAVVFVALQVEPRAWTAEDVTLVEETAERTWEAVERGRAEAAVRESEARYRTLFESIDQGFCVIDVLFDEQGRSVDYRFVEVNPAFERHTGLVDAVGHTARELLPALEEHWIEIYGRVARTREPARFESGSEVMGRWFDVYALPIGPPAGHQVALLFADITERKAYEERLREAKWTAEQASQAKSRFLAVMSHELRTPLSGVIGFADLMTSEVLGPLTAKQQEALSRIKASSWHLVGIIDEILALSRAEAGKEEVHWAEADLSEITRDVVRIVQPSVDEPRLVLRMEGPDHPVPVRTDPGKVRQILLNLVGNAAKYTREGEIAVWVDDSASEWLQIRVQDTGPGISPDDRERIFDPFTQVDSSNTRGGSGTGLGLAICRRLAELMGGEVMLESVVGEGSTFTLRLPRRAPDEPPR